jgi:hypothetical protein
VHRGDRQIRRSGLVEPFRAPCSDRVGRTADADRTLRARHAFASRQHEPAQGLCAEQSEAAEGEQPKPPKVKHKASGSGQKSSGKRAGKANKAKHKAKHKGK